MLTLCLSIPAVSLIAEESLPEVTTSTELPSVTYLKKEKRSIAASTTTAPLSSPIQSLRSPRSGWSDPDFEFGGSFEDGNMGTPAPIGDATLPIVISIVLLYVTYRYRTSTTSKRRNNL